MDKNITDLFKNYDNDMSPRFGHTITLGKIFIFIIQSINQRLFYLVALPEQIRNFQSTLILMSFMLNQKNG
jgi:hypothetical protein